MGTHIPLGNNHANAHNVISKGYTWYTSWAVQATGHWGAAATKGRPGSCAADDCGGTPTFPTTGQKTRVDLSDSTAKS